MDERIGVLKLPLIWRVKTVCPFNDRLMVNGKNMRRYLTERGVLPICNDLGVETDTPSETVEDISGTDSGKKGRGKKSPGVKVTKLPSCSLPTNMTPTFYVGGGNGVSLVEAPLVNLGWKRITDKYDERFKLKWVECKTRINYGAFREGDQLVNHLPNSHLLTNKLGLLNSLKEYERVTLSTKGRLPRLRMSDFHPETYKLDEKSDRELFLEVYKDNEMWICKPVGMNQGKGIFIIRSREAINQILEEREQKKQQAQKPGRPLMNRIVQRYITNPLLLEDRKFDVRAYMLVASTVPFLILYHKGYVRLCCNKYEADNMDLGRHLTNQFVQKKDPNYKEMKENTAWSMDKFNDYINQNIRPDCPVEIEEDWVYNTFTKQMQKIMIHCFNSVKHKLQSRIGYFDLFGLDFMVDTDMKAWLLEMNVNPSMSRKCRCQKEVLPGLIAESLYVAIECFEKSKKHLPLMPLQSLKNFTILYCGTRPNTIIPRQSRSVSPVKDNNTAEKQKPALQGSVRQGTRSLTQSTPLYAASQRRASEKLDSLSNAKDTSSNSQALSSASSKSGKVSSNSKPSAKSKLGKEGSVVSNEEEINGTEESVQNNKDSDKNEPSKNELKKEKVGTVVIDTLSKTTDSLNEATSALGRLSLTLDQGGLTDSLLEEVRLKMTHAEIVNNATKPTSAKSTRERENLERGS
ncbi:protein polyglycylase TTLL10-like isoform X2 [Ruditapes philippinarum]|uniref:protein polyglycylase TTLL10-like isoform X2 n=1 Tax=Ruditapes philippinarum TaxID=129788 RepID=UPI00295C2C60|nr:protein polyglycylase TTLL10-like isoform X2 [Ruditapes philippinarum]